MGHRLAIDTSGSFCSVALHRSDGFVFHVESEGNGDHFERLSPLVESLCSQAQVGLLDLTRIVIGVGPGSFTGLRIGMSFAKGVASAGKVPIVGVSSFLGVAKRRAMVEGASGPLLVISDARRQEVFAGEYRIEDGHVIEVNAPFISADCSVSRWVDATGGVVVTPLREWALSGIDLVVEPRISEGLLGIDRSTGAFSWEELALVEPEYVRGVSAKSIAERSGS
jgi:tRNA threonylcarbamoyl adenosine modification protein YeaZ